MPNQQVPKSEMNGQVLGSACAWEVAQETMMREMMKLATMTRELMKLVPKGIPKVPKGIPQMDGLVLGSASAWEVQETMTQDPRQVMPMKRTKLVPKGMPQMNGLVLGSALAWGVQETMTPKQAHQQLMPLMGRVQELVPPWRQHTACPSLLFPDKKPIELLGGCVCV